MEIWKEVNGTNGDYLVSSLGRMISRKCGSVRHVKFGRAPQGYYKIHMCVDRGDWVCTLHRIVALAFIPNPQNKPCINHINGIKTDNRIENLEWCTYKENTHHAIRIGIIKPFELGYGRVKLTENDVVRIRELATIKSRKEIAELYNVTQGNINAIIRRRIWKHIA